MLLTRGKHLYDRIILQLGNILNDKASLNSPLFIEVPVPNQESEW
jgi:hypothetical protein